MDDLKIYHLAGEVLGAITQDLNAGTYARLGGELSLYWSTDEVFGAFASSPGEINQPPVHSITVHYKLVRQVWRDAENFCNFLRNAPDGSDVDKLLTFYGGAKLPTCFDDEECVQNLFVAAITWVYFHEIGHLMQEHGVIRGQFGPQDGDAKRTTELYDLQASKDKLVVGREALVSHVTELAADFEATHFYVAELIRHARDHNFVDEKARNEVVSGLLYLMVSGLSLVFFRFNGKQPILPTPVVEGSHPKPLIRLEFIVPQIFEALDGRLARALAGHELDREQLVSLCTQAASAATVFWTMTETENLELDNRFMLKGLLTDSIVLRYLQPIVETWNEMLPTVKQLRHFGSPRGLMTFTAEFEERIFKVIPWGSGPEAATCACSPPDVRDL
ncbi:hypothetical protein [Achromobacter animicus]|uniref:hypothetical protein n=1 Tax=Achromobacter animicus TaxID=1389935 RepID=UPI002448D8DB|nr:hypothetical protein [Achromobacter animicus]MDH0683053.1 hypothetical protein [Achromobacter animicus]